jgi:hypothetical protein
VRALAMVAEVVHGAPYRFSDPARFSLAHGGKDGHPFPVPLTVYDETIRVLKSAIQSAKLGRDEELGALRRLDDQARALERHARGPDFESLVADERALARLWRADRVRTGAKTRGPSGRLTPFCDFAVDYVTKIIYKSVSVESGPGEGIADRDARRAPSAPRHSSAHSLTSLVFDCRSLQRAPRAAVARPFCIRCNRRLGGPLFALDHMSRIKPPLGGKKNEILRF